MPCDQVRTIKVAAGKMVAEHLIKGLEALGYSARQSGTRVSFNKGYYQRSRTPSRSSPTQRAAWAGSST